MIEANIMGEMENYILVAYSWLPPPVNVDTESGINKIHTYIRPPC